MHVEFGLIVRGQMTQDVQDAIYEAVPEGLLSIDRDGLGGLIELDCDSEDPFEDIMAAYAAIDSIDGTRVERIEPDELVYAAEIADRVGRSRSSIDQLVAGARGPGNFPPPVTHASQRNPLWRWSDVEDWFASYEDRPIDERARELRFAIAMTNALLEQRRSKMWVAKERVAALRRLIVEEDLADA